MSPFRCTALGLAIVLALGGTAHADEDASPPKIVVAVLDFQTGQKDMKDLAAAMPGLVESRLGETPSLRLVTRRDLEKIQEEQSLNLAGLVAEGKGVAVGKLIGAQVLVVGHVARIDEEILLTAKAIGAATGAFLPALARGSSQEGAVVLADRLAQSLRDVLVERAGEILPAAAEDDAKKEAELRKAIQALHVELPRLALHVPERHLRSRPAPDPAASMEILGALPRLGFPIAAVKGSVERSWLERAAKGEASFPGPTSLPADLAVVGEAFSEYAGRVGRFVSCRARLELKVYDMKTGKIVATHVGAGAAADLSEVFAAKKALEELGKKAVYAIAMDLARSM